MNAIDGPARIRIEVTGSLPNIDKLISYNSITCTISGTVTYLSTDGVLVRESISLGGSISELSSS
jgi:hypothetical protein